MLIHHVHGGLTQAHPNHLSVQLLFCVCVLGALCPVCGSGHSESLLHTYRSSVGYIVEYAVLVCHVISVCVM